MKPRYFRALSFFAAVLAGFASAQGVKIAGDPAAGAAAKSEASKTAAPAAPQVKKARKKPKKKSAKIVKKKPAAESKYKSRALTEGSQSSYRFDENGNPITGSKKAGAKAKSGSAESSDDKAACSADRPCSDNKSSDADAL